MTELLTTSRLSVARACQRKHRIRYALGYKPRKDADVLRFGTMTHKALEPWWLMPDGMRLASAFASIPSDADAFDRVRLEEMMRGYDARWTLDMAGYEVLAVEAQFETPLRNPATGRTHRRFKLGGKIDAIVKDLRSGRLLVVEHKTSSEDISPGSEYWRRLRMDGQVSIYYEGARSLGYDVSGCLYDVLGKPQLRPYQPGKTRKEAETPEEFRERIAKAIAEEPARYYQRGEVVRLESEMEDALFDIWQLAQQIHESERAGRAPRNPDACTKWNQVCPYFDVCTGVASLDDPLLFEVSSSIHPELEERPKEEAQQ